MKLVKAYPMLSLSSSNPAGVSNGFNPGVATLMKFNVTAHGGDVNLKGITITPTFGTTVSTTSQYIRVYDSNDLGTVLGQVLIGASGAEKYIEFTDAYTMSEGQVKEFTVKVDATGLDDDNSIRVDLVSSDTASTGTDWQWNDDTIGTYINGYHLFTLPLEGNTFTR